MRFIVFSEKSSHCVSVGFPGALSGDRPKWQQRSKGVREWKMRMIDIVLWLDTQLQNARFDTGLYWSGMDESKV